MCMLVFVHVGDLGEGMGEATVPGKAARARTSVNAGKGRGLPAGCRSCRGAVPALVGSTSPQPLGSKSLTPTKWTCRLAQRAPHPLCSKSLMPMASTCRLAQ